MDEAWLVRELAALGVEDEEVLVPYITGILETDGGTAEQVVECIAGYCSETADLNKFQTSLEEKWLGVVEQRALQAKLAANAALPETSAEPVISAPAAPKTPIKIDQADKEATLRMARQIVDKERRAYEAALAAPQAQQEDEQEMNNNGNRAAVQHKLQQAQKQREGITKAKLTQSKTAAAEDRKDKEQRKLDRQKRAQKGERRA